MHSTMLRWITICVAVALAQAAPIVVQAQFPTRPHLQLMIDAMPTRALATPKKPRRILVFTRSQGFVHSSIPYGAKAMELLGEKSGAFTATPVSDESVQDPMPIPVDRFDEPPVSQNANFFRILESRARLNLDVDAARRERHAAKFPAQPGLVDVP